MGGWYFLTKDRDLKFGADPEPGAVRAWLCREKTPGQLWRVAIEARALGLSEEETRAIMADWKLTDETGVAFCARAGITAERMEGGWIVGVARSRKRNEVPGPAVMKYDVGPTLVEALADLVRPGLLTSA